MRKPNTSDIIYLAGPMTGYEGYNFPAFHAAKKMIVDKYGCTVINPAEQDEANEYRAVESRLSEGEITKAYVLQNTITLLNCTGIVMLSGWWNSLGAQHELALARRLDLDVFYLCDLN